MAKPFLQDIVPKKSIRDIPISNRGRSEQAEPAKKIKIEHEEKVHTNKKEKLEPIEVVQLDDHVEHVHVVEHKKYDDHIDFDDVEDGHFHSIGRHGKKVWLWVGGLLVIIIAAIAIAGFFEKTTLTTHLKNQDAVVDGQYMASEDSGTNTASGDLSYRQLVATKESEVLVPGTSEQKVSKKATGSIVIYNNYSSASQQLIKNTRFETADGKIYRIDKSVSVPGKKTVSGKAVAGSVEATVTADAAGEAYNTSASDLGLDFTIPGFKNDPRYTGFYARSKGAFTGGYEGTIKVVSEADAQLAITKIKSDLSDALLKQALTQIPEDYILYKNAYAISFETTANNPGEKGTTIREKATFKGMLLKRAELDKEFSSRQKISDYRTTNLEDLVFAFAGKDDFGTAGKDVSFTLSGKAHLVANLNTKNIAKDALGMKKTDISKLLISYPGVNAIDVEIRPFWKSVVSKDINRVEIVTKEDVSTGVSGH